MISLNYGFVNILKKFMEKHRNDFVCSAHKSAYLIATS